MTVESLDIEEFLLFAACADDGRVLDDETCRKLMLLPASEEGPAKEAALDLSRVREIEVKSRLKQVEERNGRFFDEEVLKWFRPTRDEIRTDRRGDTSYEPDFVVETKAAKFVCETKASNEMEDREVPIRAKAAAEWCGHATKHEGENGGKPWTYLLIPHDVITDNKTLKGLAASCTYRG